MKFYKFKWLIYFFLYKFNRWLGGKTKWEYRDWQATLKESWDFCMFRHILRRFKCELGMELSKALYQIMGNPSYFYNSREPKLKSEKVDTSKFRVNERIGFRGFRDFIFSSLNKDSIA